MARPVVRVSGTVLRVMERSGVSMKSGEAKAWNMRTAMVLVGPPGLPQGMCDVTVPSNDFYAGPGLVVDWLVEVSTYSGNANLDFVSDFPTEHNIVAPKTPAEFKPLVDAGKH